MTKKTFLAAACIATLTATAQSQQLTTAQLKDMFAAKTYKGTAVHDPSVILDTISGTTPTYYIFGSHLGVAKTTDLINWTGNVGGGESNNCTLFANTNGVRVGYANAYSTHAVKKVINCKGEEVDFGNFDAHAWQYEGYNVAGNQWAPDVVWNPTMKKWLMYMSLNGDKWGSVIVCLAADKIAGPYIYQGPVVFSGFQGTYNHNGFTKDNDFQHTDYTIATGQSTLSGRYKVGGSWGTYWPNCIDPCVFYDEDGKLWMSYGSWSGGIWMFELDEKTGLRDYTVRYPYQVNGTTSTANSSADARCTSDPYFGKKIAGGYYVSGEGSYIQHIGDYYYLFMSYGGFAPDGGYEMRIFRSQKPEGPYKDAGGNSAIFDSYVLNYGPNASTNRGMKIIGAFNNWGAMTVGECAQGHNSATLDKDGNAFVVFHTKFNNGTIGHQVRTRQLFVNEKGWLVSSPFLYTKLETTQKEIESKQLYTAEEVAGDYQLLIHPYKLNHAKMAEATPVKVTLTADGKVTGERTGSWKYSEDGKSFIQINIASSTYYGVLTNQSIDGYSNLKAICITAVNNSGVPVWLYKYGQAAAIAKNYLTIENYLKSSNTLSTNAPALTDGVTAKYTCFEDALKTIPSNTLSEDGIFTPTENGDRRYINATLTNGDYYWISGTYMPKTLAKDAVADDTIYPESTTKNTTSGWWQNFSKDNYVLEQNASLKFKFYNYSNQKDNYDNWCLYGASTTHGAAGYTEYFGIRNDFWDNTTGSNTGFTANFNWDTFKADMDGSLVEMTCSYTSDGVFTMNAKITTKGGKTYDLSYTKIVAAKPASITLFFVSEGSYIDGSTVTAIDDAPIYNNVGGSKNGRRHNLAGQQVGRNYRGLIIEDGKKFYR